MLRRDFFKLAGAATGATFLLLNSSQAYARGIPASAFPNQPRGLYYCGPPAGTIFTSLSDLFKVGPGPSSSHTIAPLRISANFREMLEELPPETLAQGRSIRAHLFGSLSQTGKGHRTDRAVLAGLLGNKPETCDTKLMDELEDTTRKYTTTIQGKSFELSAETIVWDKVEHDFPYANTLVMRLIGESEEVLRARILFSGWRFF